MLSYCLSALTVLAGYPSYLPSSYPFPAPYEALNPVARKLAWERVRMNWEAQGWRRRYQQLEKRDAHSAEKIAALLAARPRIDRAASRVAIIERELWEAQAKVPAGFWRDSYSKDIQEKIDYFRTARGASWQAIYTELWFWKLPGEERAGGIRPYLQLAQAASGYSGRERDQFRIKFAWLMVNIEDYLTSWSSRPKLWLKPLPPPRKPDPPQPRDG